MTRPRMGFERSEEQVRLGDVLWDLHAAGAKVLEFTDGRGWAEFEDSELLQAFTAKMSAIAAECLRELRLKFPDEYARIPGADRMAEMTEATAPAALWLMVQEVLPGLVGEVQAMLAEWHGGGEAPGRAGERGERAEDSQERVVEMEERRLEYEE